MVRAPSHVLSVFRHRARCNTNAQIRNLAVESRDSEFRGEEPKSIGSVSVLSPENGRRDYTEMVKQVSKIMRERQRWDQTLVSDFPSFNFSDPLFFGELLKGQDNVLLSVWFFQWLCSNHDFTPDPVSCNLLFEALLDAKAVRAAKTFLDSTGFSPEPPSLEHYVMCLCEEGSIEDAIEVYFVLKEMGIRPSIATCNSVLLGCVEARKTNLSLEFYQEMIESGTAVDANAETVGCLIRAFCNNGQVSKAYELLQQVLKLGLDPGSVAYNKVIAGFCQTRNYSSMSEILHTMIARKHAPSIYTYQEIVNGLCKKKKGPEAYRIFNDLKDRGYAPDRVMYTTMIHGLCDMGWLGDARKLWFEMINKGLCPNEFTYNAMLHGYLKSGDFERANKLQNEMCERGYGETTVSCNTMISGFCLHGRSDEAFEVFKKMSEKGISCDTITYNSLIQGFCKEGKIDGAVNLLNELMDQGLNPSVSSYAALIEKLCERGNIGGARRLLDDMTLRGLEPLACTREHLITAFCAQGHVAEGMDWLIGMLDNKLKPKQTTFEKMIQCLIQIERFDNSLLVLDFMLRIGYTVKDGICHSLVSTLCQNSSDSAGNSLSEILYSS